MENKPRRRARKPQAETTEVIAKVVATVVDTRHSELIDEKISQIISLQNGLSANERMLDDLNVKIKEYSKQVMELKADNVRIRTLHNNLDYNLKHAYEQLSKLPKIVKWFFKVK